MFLQSRQANDVYDAGTEQFLRAAASLTTAQRAYEAVMLNLDPDLRKSRGNLYSDARNFLPMKIRGSKFRPHQDCGDSVMTVFLTNEQIESSSATPEQKQLAEVYLEFMTKFQRGLSQINAVNSNLEPSPITMDAILCYNTPKSASMTLGNIITSMFPDPQAYYDQGRVKTTLQPFSALEIDGQAYPNLIDFARETVTAAQLQVDNIMAEAEATFLDLLTDLKKLFAQTVINPDLEPILKTALDSFFARFPCHKDGDLRGRLRSLKTKKRLAQELIVKYLL